MSRRSRLLSSLLLLGALHAAAVFAPFLAPYDPDAQHRILPFAPPTRIHLVDATGRIHLRPFVYATGSTATGVYSEDTSAAYPVRFFTRRPGDSGEPPAAGRRLIGVDEPGHLFLLGTDGFGRDQFSRLLYGGRISLFAGILAAAVALALGLGLGALAGYYGKMTDEVIMRGTELLLALPWLYCLLAFRAFLPLNVTPRQTLLMLVLVIGLRGWARPARLIRGVVLSARERDFVLAARGFGASDLHILVRHVLPQTFGVLLTQAALLIPQFILAEVTLSFLGLGFGEPSPTWGNMLANLQHYSILTSYWWMSLPGVILILTFLGYHILANALHEHSAADSGRVEAGA